MDKNTANNPPATRQPSEELSLVALRAFREVAKHKNFSIAAKCLGVTQGAMSHHIRTLEQQYQVSLFERVGRRLEMTVEGRMLFDVLDSSLAAIEKAVYNLREGRVRQALVLGVLSSFASKWLLPRIGSFYRANPDIELTIRTVNHTIDISREPFDLAVINAPTPPDNEQVLSKKLWNEKLFVVCSRAYFKRNKNQFDSQSGLGGHVLLHDETEMAAERGLDWATYLVHNEHLSALRQGRSQFFSQSDMVLQAAIAGHGMALTRTSLAATDMAQGRLLNPFPAAVMDTPTDCYLCGRQLSWNSGAVKRLRDWLLAEASL